MLKFLQRLFKAADRAPEIKSDNRLHHGTRTDPVESPHNLGISSEYRKDKASQPSNSYRTLEGFEQNLERKVNPVSDRKWVGWNFCGWVRIVGVTRYAEAARRTARYGTDGAILELIREPENFYDSNAVMVFYGSEQIGYIDRNTARTLNEKFSREMPIRAIFKRGYLGENGAIAIDILPQMPAAKERREEKWEVA